MPIRIYYYQPSLSKKARSAPIPDSSSKPILSTPTTIVVSILDDKPSSVGDISYHEMRKPFVVSGSVSEDSFECPNSSPQHPKSTYVPNWEEVSELLRHIHSFTKRELLMQDMRALFLATQRLSV